LFCTPDIAEVIIREANRHAQKFLENLPNLKLKSTTQYWKEMNTIEIIKLLTFFLLQQLHQKLDIFGAVQREVSPSTQISSLC
jgi:hypothetical protein